MTTEPIKLTDEQIAHLFKFVEGKFVKEYDIQVELVDHLASRIEEMMGTEKMSFESALSKVYAGFGIFGFHNLLTARRKAAFRHGQKLWWQEFKNLFAWPEILTSILIAGVLYLAQFLFGWAVVGVVSAVAVVLISSTLLVMNKSKKGLVGQSFSNGILNFTMFCFIQLALQGYLYLGKLGDYPLSAFFILLTFILSYLALVKVHLKMIEIYKIQYPQAFA